MERIEPLGEVLVARIRVMLFEIRPSSRLRCDLMHADMNV
jgi:hypothetical protein